MNGGTGTLLHSPRFCLDHAAQVAVTFYFFEKTWNFKRHGFELVAFLLYCIFSFHIPISKFFKSRWTSENFEVSFGEGVAWWWQAWFFQLRQVKFWKTRDMLYLMLFVQLPSQLMTGHGCVLGVFRGEPPASTAFYKPWLHWAPEVHLAGASVVAEITQWEFIGVAKAKDWGVIIFFLDRVDASYRWDCGKWHVKSLLA